MRQIGSFLILFLCVGLDARAANFTASLDRDSITLGENATLALTFEGGQPESTPMPEVPGLQIGAAGTSQMFSSINGTMTATVTVDYSIVPQRTGIFVIPAITVQIDGHQLSSQPLKLTVFKAGAAPAIAANGSSEIVFMKLSLPTTKVYVGQTLTAQLQVWVRDDAQQFGNFQFTSQAADGFTINKMVQGQNQREQEGGHAYTVIPLTFALTVAKAGALSLGPFSASATYVVPSATSTDIDQIFGQFFNSGEQRRISLSTEALTVESSPLPTENVPANFNGAVGDFTLNATAGPTNVAVGDPVTIRVQISGQGALGAITPPDLHTWDGFKVFPSTSKVETTDQLGLEGTKTFEEIVAPQNANVHALPEFSFSYFDPGDGQYHTLTQPSVPLSVHTEGAPLTMPAIGSQKADADNRAPQDILPIKEHLGSREATGAPLVARPGFLTLQTLPVIGFLAALVWRKRTDRIANDPRLRRQREVAKLDKDGLDNLRKLAAENNSAEFFTTLFRLLQEELGAQLDCPASAITENAVDEYAVLRCAPKATLDGLRETFQLCNQARYAAVSGVGELTAVVARFEKIVGELQKPKA
jgi:hypothetical protein